MAAPCGDPPLQRPTRLPEASPCPPAWNAEERPFCSLCSDACPRSPAHRLGHTSAGRGAPRLIRLQPRRIGLQPSSHMVTGAGKWWVLLRADANSALLLESSQSLQSDSNRVDSLTSTTRPSLPRPVAEDAAALTQDAPAAVGGDARRLILQQADCGECKNCLDKPKFGGRGIKKQACLRRSCYNPQEGSDESPSSP